MKLVTAASQDVRWREQSIRLQSLCDAGAEDTSSDQPTQALDHRESNGVLTELLSPPGRVIFLARTVLPRSIFVQEFLST